MAIRQCGACYQDTLEGKDDEFCYHQEQVLKNPHYDWRHYMRAHDRKNIMYFELLKNFCLPNIL